LNGIFGKFLERFLPSLPIGLPAAKARDLRCMSSAALAMLPCRHLRTLLHHRPQIYNIPAHLMPNYGTLENSALLESFLRYDFAPSALPAMPICLTLSHFVSFLPIFHPANRLQTDFCPFRPYLRGQKPKKTIIP